MTIQLSDRFTFVKLLRFTIPTIIMLIFTSVYNVVDGFLFQTMSEKLHSAPSILLCRFC